MAKKTDSPSICILHLEDDPKESELVLYLLESEGMAVSLTRVEDQEGFEAALRDNAWDLILSDFSLPRFDGPAALEIAKLRHPETPFIFLSGKMGEELALESLKQGARDYVLKDFRPRLIPAIQRAMKEARDRKEKAQADWKLQSTEAKLMALIETSTTRIWSLDTERRFMTFNGATAEFCRKSLGIVLRPGLPFEEIVSPERGELWKGMLTHALGGLSIQKEIVVGANGAKSTHEVSLNPIRSGNIIIGVAVFSRDISERKRFEKQILEQRDELERVNSSLLENQSQLIHSGKLASLGQLAAGVAHEINNPMSFITSNLRAMGRDILTIHKVLEGFTGHLRALQARPAADLGVERERLETLLRDSRIERVLQDIGDIVSESLEGAERVNEIVRTLKSVSRTDETVSEPTDIHACLEDSLKLAWNELKHKCTIVKEFGELPRVPVRPGHVKQVFLNLLVNSAQAMPQPGTVTIRTSAHDGFIQVEIEDTGTGISDENLAHLFTPFFTTKPVGEGTGLGLSISHGIIQKHGGEMRVRSKVGVGTVFTITLPTVSPEGAEPVTEGG